MLHKILTDGVDEGVGLSLGFGVSQATQVNASTLFCMRHVSQVQLVLLAMRKPSELVPLDIDPCKSINGYLIYTKQ